MITYVVGNLLERPAKVLVNTVNTVRGSGKGRTRINVWEGYTYGGNA